MIVEMKIQSYRPKSHRKWDHHDTGVDCELYHEVGLIHVFTHYGSKGCNPFTKLEIWIGQDDTLYYARLDRAYHERWINRIANDFAWQVQQIRSEESNAN